MNSLEIREFDYTLRNFVKNNALPNEVKKLILASLVGEISALADEEIEKQLAERTAQNGKNLPESD